MILVHVSGEPCTTLSLPHTGESVMRARRQMVTELLDFGMDRDVITDAEIVLGELAANAVQHGRPIGEAEFDVSWCVVSGLLRITVADGGEASDLEPTAFDPETLRGRGLQMVDSICDRWRAERDRGTRITAELHL